MVNSGSHSNFIFVLELDLDPDPENILKNSTESPDRK